MTSQLLHARHLTAVDASSVFVESLQRQYGRLDNTDVIRADPRVDDFSDRVGSGSFDTVVLLNDLQRTANP